MDDITAILMEKDKVVAGMAKKVMKKAEGGSGEKRPQAVSQ